MTTFIIVIFITMINLVITGVIISSITMTTFTLVFNVHDGHQNNYQDDHSDEEYYHYDHNVLLFQ